MGATSGGDVPHYLFMYYYVLLLLHVFALFVVSLSKRERQTLIKLFPARLVLRSMMF